MKTVISRIDLGVTRIAGYCLFEESTGEFEEKTPKQVKDLIKRHKVNGLILKNDKIELDKEGFNTTNLMVKSGIGKFRPLYETDSIINCMYAVVRVILYDDKTVYQVINNRCARKKFSKEKLKLLMELGNVAGVRLVDNNITVCNGVIIEDLRNNKKDVEAEQSEEYNKNTADTQDKENNKRKSK